MNIAICDDDKEFRAVIEKHLQNYFNEKNIFLSTSHFSSGEEFIESESLFDLVFLDVEMGGMNGIEAGEKLNMKNPHSIVFVVTSYDGYLDDAFKIHAFRFLSKPLDVLRLYKALDNAAEFLNDEMIVFYDTENFENVRIYTKDILYLEVENKKTKIMTLNGIFHTNENLTYWRTKFNNISFVSPHSSYIANLDYSISHTRKSLVLGKKDCDGNILETYEIAIAPKKQASIRKSFFSVLERR